MTDGLARTPEPPYVAVIFSSLRTEGSGGDDGYGRMAVAMEELAAQQEGYLGIEAARESVGITVSYWRDEQAALAWKQVTAHLGAQRLGRERWYADYVVRVAVVVRDYDLASSELESGASSASASSISSRVMPSRNSTESR